MIKYEQTRVVVVIVQQFRGMVVGRGVFNLASAPLAGALQHRLRRVRLRRSAPDLVWWDGQVSLDRLPIALCGLQASGLHPPHPSLQSGNMAMASNKDSV